MIAATNKDLREEVRAGHFRQDLYHRLSVLTVNVPPLRERGVDCLLLFDHFRQLYASTVTPFTLSKEAEKYLEQYSFPGNVRELRNIVIRLGAKYPGKCVGAEELNAELESAFVEPIGTTNSDLDEAAERELMSSGFRLDETLNECERRYINAALKLSDGNLSKAAKLLGINRTTLYSKLQRLSLGEV